MISNIATFLEELTEDGKIEYVKGYPNPTTDIAHIQLPITKNTAFAYRQAVFLVITCRILFQILLIS